MITGETDSVIKDQSALTAFVERASGRLAGIRNGILIFDQDRSSEGDIDVSLRGLQLLRRDSIENERLDIVDLADQCETLLKSMLLIEPTPAEIGRALDLVARMEERLLNIPLGSDDFLDDVSGFVEASFSFLKTDKDPGPEPPSASDDALEFEVDEETLEIFRSEAAELLSNISEHVRLLSFNSDDRDALWEVRRNAHTFKGAAGIVGLKAASTLAHRVEDLLDKMVEAKAAIDAEIVNLLVRASKRLEVFTLGTNFDEETGPIDALYSEFERVIDSVPARRKIGQAPAGSDASGAKDSTDVVVKPKPAPKPIVRVSLDRLDELIQLSDSLAANRSAIVGGFAEFLNDLSADTSSAQLDILHKLFDLHHHMTSDIRDKLLQIRMVRFGTLETRLSRAVHVTCEEEHKSAFISLENGDCEVDTQVIDALIEPLLHLLKNAVVHGIETEETRRLIGKPDKGNIRIRVDSDVDGVTLIVADDGRGISATRLVQKALHDGLITADAADEMSDAEAFELIFQRGLTTAEQLNLNAGRGVGMSIVKEGLESHGGSITVASEPQVGTTFTLRMPLAIKKTPFQGTAPTPTASTSHSTESRSALVLVIDDSPSIRRQTSKLVTSLGHRVITAINGAEAIELLLSNVYRPDLILSDVEMPVMDGWGFLECVKNTDGLDDIPVIMVTSLTADEYIQRAYDLGAAEYKVKPLAKGDLEHSINSVLERAATVTEPVAG